MRNAPVRMSAFAGKVKLGVIIVIAGERHALIHQPLHRVFAVFHHKAHGFVFAQSSTCDMGIANMVFGGVVITHYRSNATLRPGARGIQ